MLAVRFFTIRDDRRQEIGAVRFDGTRLHVTGRITDRLLDSLLRIPSEGPIDRDDPAAVERALRLAPERFNGGGYGYVLLEEQPDEA